MIEVVPDTPIIARIGCLNVRIAGDLPECCRGLTRDRCKQDASVDVSLQVDCRQTRDWVLSAESATGSKDRFSRFHPGHCMMLDWDSRLITLRLVEVLTPMDLAMIRRDIFCALAALSGQVLVHASAVVRQGRGYVFCGPSGSGKSTIARLLAGGSRVVNDEINWIVFNGSDAIPRLVDQGYWLDAPPTAIAGTAIAGTAIAGTVPLAGLFVLGQAAECCLEPAPSAEAFPVLLAAPYGGADPLLTRRAKATALLLARQPAARLQFSRDRQAIERVLWSND